MTRPTVQPAPRPTTLEAATIARTLADVRAVAAVLPGSCASLAALLDAYAAHLTDAADALEHGAGRCARCRCCTAAPPTRSTRPRGRRA